MSLSARVGIAALFVEASFIADANGMLVVMAHMCAGYMLRTAFVILAIAGDVPVVATVVGIASGAMTALQVFESEILVAACRAAM